MALDFRFALAAARGGLDFAGFVDDAGELVDEFFFGEVLSFLDVDEGDVGALEEFFHVAGVAAWLVLIVADTVFELDGADGAKRALIAEDEVDGFVVDEAVGGVAVLGADFVAEEGREANFGDDVEFFAEEVI